MTRISATTTRQVLLFPKGRQRVIKAGAEAWCVKPKQSLFRQSDA